MIIDTIKERYSKTWSADKLQKEFYQLQQDRGEKIHLFAGQLEQRFHRLKAKFPDCYENKQLKDRLFHGMPQHLQDSVRFLYKQEGTTYEQLLSSTQEAETEVTKGKGAGAKSKAATTGTSENQAKQDICECIDCFTATLKFASLREVNWRVELIIIMGFPRRRSWGHCPIIQWVTPLGKSMCQGTSVAGPLMSGQHPMQCHGMSIPLQQTSTGGSLVRWIPLCMPKAHTPNKSNE